MGQYFGKVESYEDLEVWKVGMEVAEAAYRITKEFPKEELFSIVAQIRRAASSVPFNIAEGWGRGAGASNINSCKIARGSTCELRTALQLARRLEYGEPTGVDSLIKETAKLRQLVHAYILGMEKNIVREPVAPYGNEITD